MQNKEYLYVLLSTDQFGRQEMDNENEKENDINAFGDVSSVFSEIRNQIIANLTRTRMTSALYKI